MYKPLLRKFGIMLLLSITAYAVNYGLNIILARLLSPVNYGNFAIIKEILLFTSLLFLQGSNFAVLKYVPEYIHSNQNELLHGYFRYTAKTFTLSCCVLLGITLLALVLWLTKNTFGISLWLILTMAILTLIFSLLTYLVELLRAIQRIFLSTLLFDILMPLVFALFAVRWLLVKYKISLLDISAIYLVAMLVLTIIAAVTVYRGVKKYLVAQKTVDSSPLWRTSSLHLLISKLVLTILFSSEIIILKIFGSIPEDTGIFAAILTVGSLYWVLFNAVTYVLSPMISPLVYSKDKAKLRHLFLLSTGLLLGIAILLSAVLIIWRLPILQYFGAEFARGSIAYIITIIGFTITVGLGLPWYFIGLSGHQKKLVLPVSLVTLGSIIVTAILVHYFNLIGAAIGLAGTDVFMGFLLTSMLYKLDIV
jgi:O-antigen/teichoic acid export membrane protein